MKYAISNWIYADEPLRETFRRLARYGYDGIELIGEPARYVISEVKDLCREFTIGVTSVLAWCIYGIPGRDGTSPVESERQAARRYIEACLDFAHAVDAPILVLLAAPAGRVAPAQKPVSEADWDEAYRSEWHLSVEGMRHSAAYAAKYGITLALEPLNRYESFLVNTVDQALRFLEDVGAPNLKLHLDTFHMNIEEADQAAAIRTAGERLVNMHISDSNREAPGRGHTDFAGMMQALLDIRYEGALALEPVPPGADGILATKMSKYLPLRDLYAEEGIRHLKSLEVRLR